MKSFFSAVACCAVLVSAPLVAAAQTSDRDLDSRIEKTIHQDSVLKTQDVKVDVNGGVVTLTGTVADAVQKERAARLARINGVTGVENQITVSPGTTGTKGTLDKAADSTKEGLEKAADKTKEGASIAVDKTKEGVQKSGAEVTDAFILAAVKAHFIGEDVLKGSDINVDCDRHVVTLRGTVPTAAGKARAVELAKTTNGVDRVVDMLEIGPKR